MPESIDTGTSQPKKSVRDSVALNTVRRERLESYVLPESVIVDLKKAFADARRRLRDTH